MDIKAGDILRVKRTCYSHWGVYVGNNEVIHFTDGKRDSNLKNKKSARIMCTPLSIFMGDEKGFQIAVFPDSYTKSRSYVDMHIGDMFIGDKFRKAIKRKADYKIFPREEVVKRAESFLNVKDAENYHLFNNNCEHFASWCKTGVAISFQADIIDRFIRKVIDPIPDDQRRGSGKKKDIPVLPIYNVTTTPWLLRLFKHEN